MKVAASPRIYMGDARMFAMAGFPRIDSLPLEGKAIKLRKSLAT
mgnify:FL=1